MPPANKYDTVINWEKALGKRGKFSKSPRVTFTESILHEEIIKPKPGPGAYDHSKFINAISKKELLR